MQATASATKTVSDWFDKDLLNGYVQSSVNSIAEGRPKLDGTSNVAALHSYNTQHGKVCTLATWVKGTPMHVYVGTEEEIKDIKEDFRKVIEDSGFSIKKTPKERAEQRKKERKKKR